MATGFALGIVGHAQEKFTAETELLAREAIRHLIVVYGATMIVSGRSPMGGVDLYAEEIAADLGIPTMIFPPATHHWETGFRPRNLQIANASDLVACVVVSDYPPGYEGLRVACYHCKGRNPQHVKSGGCWTAWKARARRWVIIWPGGVRSEVEELK